MGSFACLLLLRSFIMLFYALSGCSLLCQSRYVVLRYAIHVPGRKCSSDYVRSSGRRFDGAAETHGHANTH